MNLWLAIPFYLGLALALLRWRHAAYLTILLTSLVGLLLPGVLSEYAPHFHRILGAAAPAALLCGVGLDWLWGLGKPRAVGLRWPATMLRLASVLLIVLGGAVWVHDYFVRWAALPDLFYAFDVGLWEVGQQIAMPPGTQVYLTRVMLRTRPSPLRCKQGHPPHQRWFHSMAGIFFPLTAATTDRPELYVAIEHEDFRTRLLLPEIFPSAVVTQEIADAQGEIYARFYTRPAQTTPLRPPQRPFAAEIGDGIRLMGYDLQPATLHHGEMLYLQLHWLVDKQPAGDWTVFTHLTNPNAGGSPTVVAGHDSRPGEGSLPTTRWQAGWRVYG